MEHILSVKDLTKVFIEKKLITRQVKSSYTALNGISFDLRPGEILGVLGPNGAGKTTLMQILLNLMTPTSGSVYYFGKDFFKDPRSVLQHIAFASTYIQLPGNLTIYENLSIYAQLYTIPRAEQKARMRRFLEQFGMWQVKDKLCKQLSAGQITRVILAKAFMSHPKLVLLDEPTASLDPDIALDVRNFVRRQQEEFGVSMLFTSHNMTEVAEVCDRVMVLKKGNIIAMNTPEELVASIADVHMHLTVVDTVPLEQFLREKGLSYTVEKQVVSIDIDEKDIPQLLGELGRRSIPFSHIVIDTPSLEDYFLHISRAERNEGAL